MSRSRPRVAVVVRHYHGEGRLSGLVSFVREFVTELGKQADVRVLSGTAPGKSMENSSGADRDHIAAPFWINVWRKVNRAKYDSVVILSGIHSPRWAPMMYGVLSLCPIPSGNRIFVQAVTLDSPWRTWEARLLRRQARMVTLNPAEGLRLRSSIPDVVVTTPGLDLGMISSRPTSSRSSGFRIGFFGHLNEVKGADRLPRIIDGLAPGDWDVVVAGTGNMSGALRDWANSHDNIAIHGFLEDQISLLKSCDVLLAPFRQSATVLGVSQVVIEAMACGIPVVGTPVEAITGAVVHEQDALLAVTDGDLAKSIQDLMDNADKRRRLAQAAKANSARFAIERVVRDVMTGNDRPMQGEPTAASEI